MSTFTFPSPAELGAPACYTDWRDSQLDAYLSVRASTARFRIANLPTGSGKQLLAYMLALAVADEGGRVLILTESRGLQTQYEEAFREARIPLVDIRGAENYRCPALEPGGRYAHLHRGQAEPHAGSGPCNSGMPCKLRDDGCPRFDAVRAARSARIVISNYAYRLNAASVSMQQPDADEPLGDFDMLVLDEFHAARGAVARVLTVDISLRALATDLGLASLRTPHADDMREWSAWARSLAARAEQRQRDLREQVRAEREFGGSSVHLRGLLEQARYLRRHIRSLSRIASAKGEWVVDVWKGSAAGIVKFAPVWAAPYCEELLYRDVPVIVGMSATASRASLKYVGVSMQQADYFEYESTFPVANRPVYVVPVARVQWNMSQDDERRWLACIDAILRSRSDRKALVHPVSYDRTQKILTRSAHRHRMVSAKGGKETAEAVERFKTSQQVDQVFVHPGISTGYDFPDAAAELQIIGKIPFADNRNKLVKAWKESDPQFAYVQAMEYVQQAAGRINRRDTDFGETFIVDAHALWFLDRNGPYAQYATSDFWKTVKVVRGGMLPAAPKRMTSGR